MNYPTLDQFCSLSPTISWLGDMAIVPFPSSWQSLLVWLLKLSMPLGPPAASVLTVETPWSWVALASPAPFKPLLHPPSNWKHSPYSSCYPVLFGECLVMAPLCFCAE